MDQAKKCINCQRDLVLHNGTWLCEKCNTRLDDVFEGVVDGVESDEYVFIECPGATLYEPGTNSVIRGVKFVNEDDPFMGHRIIVEPVYPPTHTKRRRIKREALGKIRRCQACQDYTIRMRRPEGPDFYIPSHKHPGRTKLKTVTTRSTE
jgi:ribosomal protein L37AE/L43A